ncbi:MAG: Lrp/AsnC family transcriptional regulator [Proteobacteria bacterium]|nr:MAG: Lrp/AsnC family transcriptional regulator [Pseudomonadota bacterium]QKK11109.1 MAG: Lrp/AsnC ligand binding domain-containing protein [Pseudomonadota bacterium]
MITAIVMLKVTRDRIPQVAEELADIKGISEVFSVSGRYDLVAIIRAESNDELADLVTGHLLKVEGITDSETLIAFKVYSRHDLDTMFSVGMEM